MVTWGWNGGLAPALYGLALVMCNGYILYFILDTNGKGVEYSMCDREGRSFPDVSEAGVFQLASVLRWKYTAVPLLAMMAGATDED